MKYERYSRLDPVELLSVGNAFPSSKGRRNGRRHWHGANQGTSIKGSYVGERFLGCSFYTSPSKGKKTKTRHLTDG